MPLIKKPNLERNNMKNYRPISNLSFISKLIERAVATEVNQHVYNTNLASLCSSSSFTWLICRVWHRRPYYPNSKTRTSFWTWRLGTQLVPILSHWEKIVHIYQTSNLWCCLFSFWSTAGFRSGSLTVRPLHTSAWDIVHRHDIDIHMHADDTQLYATMNVCDKLKLLHHRN